MFHKLDINDGVAVSLVIAAASLIAGCGQPSQPSPAGEVSQTQQASLTSSRRGCANDLIPPGVYTGPPPVATADELWRASAADKVPLKQRAHAEMLRTASARLALQAPAPDSEHLARVRHFQDEEAKLRTRFAADDPEFASARAQLKSSIFLHAGK